MSGTIAKQAGWVQLAQSDMYLVLNVAKTSKGGFSCAAIEKMQYVIKQPCAAVEEGNMWGDGFSVHNDVKAVM